MLSSPLARVAFLVVVTAHVALASCATEKPPAPPPEPPPKPKVEAPPEDDEPTEPKTWDDVAKIYGGKCPGPFFDLPTASTVETAGHTFTIKGSTLVVDADKGKWKGPLRIGVLGAIKDPDPDTRANIKKAMKEFKRVGVQFVVANGDLIGDEAGDLAKVINMLGEEITVPVFAHSGNYEWTQAFTDTMVAAQKDHPQLFNANLLRHIDFGGVHLFSLPGWSVRQFVKPAACLYGKKDVDALREQVKPLVDQGDVVIITAHGPPRGKGKQAIDYAVNAGNVGDEDLQKLLKDVPVKFGLFSHILEAGGRATSDVERQTPIKMPMRAGAKTLYVNAGSTSSYDFKMLDNHFSKGMAAVFTLDDVKSGGKARVTFLKLR